MRLGNWSASAHRAELAEHVTVRSENMQKGHSEGPPGTFQEFEATSLYCPQCKSAVPVRKRMLLVLLDGEIYEYFCAYCSESLGSKTVRGEEQVRILT